MESKIPLFVLAAFFIVGGLFSFNDSLNTRFIKWVNEGKGVKTNITPTTIKRGRSVAYFLIILGIVVGAFAFFL